MKRSAIFSLILTLSASSGAIAQANGMKEMDMHKGMDKHNCMEMKGMKGMEMQHCKDMIEGKDKAHQSKEVQPMVHKAVAVVKAVDTASGNVTLAHEPIKSLKWPAMTMRFGVQDKILFEKLAVGKKVNVELVRQGADYVVIGVQ